MKTNNHVRWAVILSGGVKSNLHPLTRSKPKVLLPFANTPLLEHLIQVLTLHGIRNIVVTLTLEDSKYRDELEDLTREYGSRGVSLFLFFESSPKGTAGSLKNAETIIGDETFLVVTSNTFLRGTPVSQIVDFHFSHRAFLTITTQTLKNEAAHLLEGIEYSDNNELREFNLIHHSRDRRNYRRAAGLYVVDPEAMESVPADRYFDIKEQLLPALIKKDRKIIGYNMGDGFTSLHNVNDYFRVNDSLITDFRPVNGYSRFNEEVWIGENTNISSRAYLLGPILIGENCTIEDNVLLVGPVCIDDGVQVEKEAIVREGIIWRGAHLGRKSRVERSILSEDAFVPPGERIDRQFLQREGTNGKRCQYFSLAATGRGRDLPRTNGSWTGSLLKVAKKRSYLALKRMMDIVLSSISLLLLSPLFAVIAITVRLTSPGPVFYAQARCGKDGKGFRMYKFRTMSADAEKFQQDLAPRKDSDGPMFKMKNDPRVTPLGRFLRRSTLDELPQLLNIVKGEMSLVGPRPLKMEEMTFSPAWRDLRLSVTPGLTGLWQVHRDQRFLSFNEWIHHDVTYVNKQSLWLDIKIILMTFVVLCLGRKES